MAMVALHRHIKCLERGQATLIPHKVTPRTIIQIDIVVLLGGFSVGQEQDAVLGRYEDSQAYAGSMTQLYFYGRRFERNEAYDTYTGFQPGDFIWGFDNCQLSAPVCGNIEYHSRNSVCFPGRC